jgi:AmiR/NasT family two-component response regulator
MTMRDFEEFERLLASDATDRERTELIERVKNDCVADGLDTTAMVSVVAVAVSRFELRKYHEWSSSCR